MPPALKSNNNSPKFRNHQLSPRTRKKQLKPGEKPHYIKNSVKWQKINQIDKELAIVSSENLRYVEFLNKMRKIVQDTIKQIEEEDPGQLAKLHDSPNIKRNSTSKLS
tara:strand:+ start:1053 stop:1376 length:324 start_codon:yes stop_codon:yes gene_type:complete